MNKLKKMVKELRRIAEEVSADHHKERDGQVDISYDAYTEQWCIVYPGYVFGDFTTKYYKTLDEALSEAISRFKKMKIPCKKKKYDKKCYGCKKFNRCIK